MRLRRREPPSEYVPRPSPWWSPEAMAKREAEYEEDRQRARVRKARLDRSRRLRKARS